MSNPARRRFLKVAAAAALGGVLATQPYWARGLQFLEPVKVDNPLDAYPTRGWEEIYRNQYRYDRTFKFCCVPNDTHNCRLTAFVRNGIITRVEQSYDLAEYRDLLGNKANAIWNPRGCLKGFTLMRRIYGPYRIRYPVIRKGWKEWVEASWPTDANGLMPENFRKRGDDEWLRVSWDEANTLVAKTFIHLAEKYSGSEGADLLLRQGYQPEMVDAMKGAGVQTMKFRPGMALAGVIRLLGMSRVTNMMALLDQRVRGVSDEEATGARIWSNYTWHGDLDPGTPMVTGVQTMDPELNDFRNSKLLVFMGKNMVENKMADAHWWIELMERGGKIVNIAPEYSPASQKSDYWLSVRPGTDVALFLGVAKILLDSGQYDSDFVKKFTDLPLLVRGDTLKLLRASEVIPGYSNKKLENYTDIQEISEELREKWGDFLVWDVREGVAKAVTRDDVGERYSELNINPALEGTFKVKTLDGKEVEVKPIFQLYKEVSSEYDLDTVVAVTGSPKDRIQQLAADLGTIKPAAIHTGEGTNHYFHNDLKDRIGWFVLALNGNVGKPGSNKGHWAGNYKHAVFGVGLLPWVSEDPFNINLDPNIDGKETNIRVTYGKEEPCYWNYGDQPLVVNTPKFGRKVFTGKSHMPTPTKVEWYANVNHLNNSKWAYNVITNVHPKVEMIIYQDWEWTASCEYADVVFPAQSWAELTQTDMTASCSNPFLEVWKGGIPPQFDNKMDHEVYAGIASKMADLTGDRRFRDYWHYILEGNSEVYLQRILDAGVATRGYRIDQLLESNRGWMLHFRTYPRIPGYEQIHESRPFYTKTGRLEFYKEEDEFIEYGENLIVFREPIEATRYLPNVILSNHSWIRPLDYGIKTDLALSDPDYYDKIQVRNIKMDWNQLKSTTNPLWKEGFRFYCLTPKTRHRVHSSWSASDWNLIWDSNFGDPWRTDKRAPGVGEHQMHMNPEDAKELGINDGDYVWVDANPNDRPYKGWKPDDPFYKVARLMLRVKYNPAYPRGITMMKHSTWMATPKSVRAQETRADGSSQYSSGPHIGLANLRYGSQQSLTRAYLQPTEMTDSLVRKKLWGWKISEGFEIDVHAPNTCPKETLVKIEKAEDGGLGGQGVWAPATTGFTPGNENDAMKRYLKGEFAEVV